MMATIAHVGHHIDPKAAIVSRRNAMECAKPQAATKLVSQAGKNVIRKTRKPAQLTAFSFQNYQYNEQYMLTSRISSMAPYKVDIVLIIHDNYDVVC